MIDSLAKVLLDGGLDPDAFTALRQGIDIFHGVIQAGHVTQTWVNLAQAFPNTKYWPIICGDPDAIRAPIPEDPQQILAAAPAGKIGDLLQSRFCERVENLVEMVPGLAEASDMYQAAALVDASGINSFGDSPQPSSWPTVPPGRVRFHTVKERKKIHHRCFSCV